MTRQTWTATVSAVLFVVLAAVIALVPVPYVAWSPGGTHDLLARNDDRAVITVTGAPTYPTTGRILMTTVAVTAPDSSLSLPEVLFSYWLPSREVLPRAAVYRVGESPAGISEGETRLMADSQSDAVVAALRESGIQVFPWPMVESVTSSGPSNGILEPGDLINAVGDVTTTSVQAVEAAILSFHVGETVKFKIVRNGKEMQPMVTTRATAAEPDKPIVGITLTTGYTYKPSVTFALDPSVGGSSAGLMFGLALTDMLTDSDLSAGRVIAGTGALAADGKVGRIGGVQEKIAAATRDGATVFLLPKDNCADVGSTPPAIRLIAVETLSEAVDALAGLDDPQSGSSIAGCG
nr:S16 family serine protease [Propionicimonas sp.]